MAVQHLWVYDLGFRVKQGFEKAGWGLRLRARDLESGLKPRKAYDSGFKVEGFKGLRITTKVITKVT